jgi:ribosomal protein L7/L12
MKIHLTITEASNIIKTYFNLPSNAMITIGPQPAPLADEDPVMIEIVNRNREHKLVAIKEIRQLTGGGLNETKIIVDRIHTKLGFDKPQSPV